MFAPKYIYQDNERFSVFGFNCTEQRIGSLDIMDIAEAEIVRWHKHSEENRVHAVLDGLRLEDIKK